MADGEATDSSHITSLAPDLMGNCYQELTQDYNDRTCKGLLEMPCRPG